MKRYVKYIGRNPILIAVFKNESQLVVNSHPDEGLVWIKSPTGERLSCCPDEELSKWVFCDEHGNELDGEKKQGYKGQFDLADYDVTAWCDDGCWFNVTETLKRIAARAG